MSELPHDFDPQQSDANLQHQIYNSTNQNSISGTGNRGFQQNNSSINNSQVSLGNNNFNNHNHNHNYNYIFLLNSDLKPLRLTEKIISYIKVIFFLLATLIFWFLFGYFADYSFPYGQGIELLLSCFRGKIATRVNDLQLKVQKAEFTSQSDNLEQVKKLNKLESEIWLYQEIIEKLVKNTSDSHERIAKTLEALEQKRSLIEDELKFKRPKKYEAFSKFQLFFRSLMMSAEEKDYVLMDKIFNSINSIQTSEIIFIKDLLEKINKDIKKRESTISPKRLKLVYKIQKLIENISSMKIYETEGSEVVKNLHETLNEFRFQKAATINELEELKSQYTSKSYEFDELTKNLNILKQETGILHSELENSRREINKSNNFNKDKENQILVLKQELNKKVSIQQSLRSQNEKLLSQIEELSKRQKSYELQIERLNQKIQEQYQKAPRRLNGDYIGILQNKNYHYHKDCPHWKSLALEYMLNNLYGERDIYIRNDRYFFVSKGLKPCDICTEKSGVSTRTY